MNSNVSANYNVNSRPVAGVEERAPSNPLQGLDKKALHNFLAQHGEKGLQALYQQLKPEDQDNLIKLLIELGYANLAVLLKATPTFDADNDAVVEIKGPNLLGQSPSVLAETQDPDQPEVTPPNKLNHAKVKSLALILEQVVNSLLKQSQNMAAIQGDTRQLMAKFMDILSRYEIQAKMENAKVVAQQANLVAQEQYETDMDEVFTHYLAAGKSATDAVVGAGSLGHSLSKSTDEKNAIKDAKDTVVAAKDQYNKNKAANPLPDMVTDSKQFRDKVKAGITELEGRKKTLEAEIKANKKILKDDTESEANKVAAKDRIESCKEELKEVKTQLEELKTQDSSELKDRIKEKFGLTSHKEATEHRRVELIGKVIDAGGHGAIGLTQAEANAIKEVTHINSEDGTKKIKVTGHVGNIIDLKTAQQKVYAKKQEITDIRTKRASMVTDLSSAIFGGLEETGKAIVKTDVNEAKNQTDLDRAYTSFLQSTGDTSMSVIHDLLENIKNTLEAEKTELLQSLAAVVDTVSRLQQAQQSANSM